MRRVPPTLPAWLAGGLLLVLAQQPWWQVSWAGSTGPGTATLTGEVATGGLAQALAFVALAGAAATLVLRRPGRRVVGVLLGLAHLAATVIGLLHPEPGADAVRDALGAASLAGSWQVAATALPWAYGATGLAGVAGAGWLLWRPVAESSRSVRAPAAEVADSLASWKAMDEGQDPTDDEEQQ